VDTLFFHQHLNAFRPNSVWTTSSGRRSLDNGTTASRDAPQSIAIVTADRPEEAMLDPGVAMLDPGVAMLDPGVTLLESYKTNNLLPVTGIGSQRRK
jgi:hypothetical protein